MPDCSKCGKQVSEGASFCASCGEKISPITKSVADYKKNASLPPPVTEATHRTLGTKWLIAWEYILAIGGIIGVVSSGGEAVGSTNPLVVFIIGAVLSGFQIVVAYGLSKRRLWAWKINWIIIFLAYIYLTFTSSGKHLRVELVVVSLIVCGLAWLLPNYFYWKKRLVLFN